MPEVAGESKPSSWKVSFSQGNLEPEDISYKPKVRTWTCSLHVWSFLPHNRQKHKIVDVPLEILSGVCLAAGMGVGSTPASETVVSAMTTRWKCSRSSPAPDKLNQNLWEWNQSPAVVVAGFVFVFQAPAWFLWAAKIENHWWGVSIVVFFFF